MRVTCGYVCEELSTVVMSRHHSAVSAVMCLEDSAVNKTDKHVTAIM